VFAVSPDYRGLFPNVANLSQQTSRFLVEMRIQSH